MLRRDRHWRLAPEVGTPAGSALPGGIGPTLALSAASAAVGQGPNYEAAPFPGQDDPDWRKAMHYIAGPDVLSILYNPATACYKPPTIDNGFGDVRSAYCGGGSSCTEWSSMGETLARLPYPSGQGFSQETWNVVVDQLAGGGSAGVGEFAMVDRVHCNVINMQSVFGTASTTALLDVETFVSKINTFLQPPPYDAFSIISTVFSDILAIAGPILGVTGFGEAAAAVVGIANAFHIGRDLANFVDGSPAGGPLPFDTTSETLAEQLITSFQTSSAALGVPDDQIVSDFTALREFYESGADLQRADITRAQTPLSLGAYTYLWKWFLGKSYPPDHAWPNSTTSAPVDPENFQCNYAEPPFMSPLIYYGGALKTQQIEAPLYDNQNGYETYVMAGTTLVTDDEPNVQQPPTGLPGSQQQPPTGVPVSLYGLPDPQSGATPPPVDPNGNITPLGLHDQFFWHDQIYAARKTQRVFQWYDEFKPVPDVPFSERQNC